jgi:hypothetical protein
MRDNFERYSMPKLKVIIASSAALLWAAASGYGATVTYTAAGGRSATADFAFNSATQLQITLTETTSSSAFVGAGAVLTSVGLELPGSFQFVAVSSSVAVTGGSQSVGFDILNGTGGFDVSREWGVTQGKFDPGSGSTWDYASVNTSHVTQLPGINRDGPDTLDGPQAGLMDDSANRGGVGVVDKSVVIKLALNGPMSLAQQAALLSDVRTNSFVEYGSDAAFGVAVVPLPAAAWMGMSLLGGVGGVGFFRRRRLVEA